MVQIHYPIQEIIMPLILFLKIVGAELLVFSLLVLALYYSSKNYYEKFVFPPPEKEKKEE